MYDFGQVCLYLKFSTSAYCSSIRWLATGGTPSYKQLSSTLDSHSDVF